MDELLSFHLEEVDLTSLSVSWTFYDEIANAISKEYPLTKLAVTMVQYNPDIVQSQARPLPDIGRSSKHPSCTHSTGTRQSCSSS